MNTDKVIINGHEIPWSFVYKIFAMCGRDWDTTIDAFWKARNCTGKNGIQRYMQCGFIPDKKGRLYMLIPSYERENGKMENIREWWMKLYIRKKKASSETIDTVKMLMEAFSFK